MSGTPDGWIAREAPEGEGGAVVAEALARLDEAETTLTAATTLTLAIARPVLLMLVRQQRAIIRLLLRRALV